MKTTIRIEVERAMLPDQVAAVIRQAARDLGRLGYDVDVEVVDLGASWPPLVDDEEVDEGSLPLWAWPDGKLHSTPPPVDLAALLGPPPPAELRPQIDAIVARVLSGETPMDEAIAAVRRLASRHAVVSSQLEERPGDRPPQ